MNIFKLSLFVFLFGAQVATGSTSLTSDEFIWDGSRHPEVKVSHLTSAQGLRVMWWNLEDGQVNRKLASRPLDKNLQNLMTSSLRPDVLVFAEYTSHSLSIETMTALRKTYAYYSFQSYNATSPSEGIAVFSQLPFDFERLGYLDWSPPWVSEAEKSNYRQQWQTETEKDSYTRPLICLKMMIGNRQVYLLPVHLLDPWRQIRNKYGLAKTVEEVLSGRDNPLWYQLESLELLLHYRFGSNLSSAPDFLLFGDFNTPRGLVVETVGYKRLTQDLKDVVINHSKTFPANSAVERKSFPNVEIDHGFTNGHWQINGAEILPLQGSDHYAMYSS